MEHLSIHQCVGQVKGNIVSDMDGEKVMLSVDNGKYYNFGEIGGRIWELYGGANHNQSISNKINRQL